MSMLLNELKKSTKKLKQLDVIENAAQNAAIKSSNDASYKKTVEEFYVQMKRIELTTSMLNFSLSSEIIEPLEEYINSLENIISNNVVDSDALVELRQGVARKVNMLLVKRWKPFYQNIANSCIVKINTIGRLSDDQERIKLVKKNIQNISDWNDFKIQKNGKCEEIVLLKQGIEEVKRLEDKLNLIEPVRNFISLVTQKKARITDINEDIIQWIREEHMEDMFLINFKN